MDICYVYCLPVPDSKAKFYALPVTRMAKMFQGTEHTIHVIAIGPLDTTELEENGAVCYIYERQFRWLGQAGFYLQLFWIVWQLIRKNGYDVCSNVWGHYNLLPVLLACKIEGGRVFARVFGQGNPWDRERAGYNILQQSYRGILFVILTRLLNRIEVRILNAVERVYVNAQIVGEMLIDHGVAESQVRVITQGVDAEFFTPPPDRQVKPTILFVGRFASDEKRFEDALTVFKLVRERLSNARFAVAGEGELSPELESTVENNNQIEMHGYLERVELREAYRTASVLLLTSVDEGVPNVILEGFACELPVVAMPAGDVERIIAESGGGEIVLDRDLEDAADKLCRFLVDDAYRSNVGKKGREYILKEHALPVAREKYLSLFDEGEYTPLRDR